MYHSQHSFQGHVIWWIHSLIQTTQFIQSFLQHKYNLLQTPVKTHWPFKFMTLTAHTHRGDTCSYNFIFFTNILSNYAFIYYTFIHSFCFFFKLRNTPQTLCQWGVEHWYHTSHYTCAKHLKCHAWNCYTCVTGTSVNSSPATTPPPTAALHVCPCQIRTRWRLRSQLPTQPKGFMLSAVNTAQISTTFTPSTVSLSALYPLAKLS